MAARQYRNLYPHYRVMIDYSILVASLPDSHESARAYYECAVRESWPLNGTYGHSDVTIADYEDKRINSHSKDIRSEANLMLAYWSMSRKRDFKRAEELLVSAMADRELVDYAHHAMNALQWLPGTGSSGRFSSR